VLSLKTFFGFPQNNTENNKGYLHLSKIYGVSAGGIFTVTANDPFTMRHKCSLYKFSPERETCRLHIKKNEFVEAKYSKIGA
jgi:hypothetical protein